MTRRGHKATGFVALLLLYSCTREPELPQGGAPEQESALAALAEPVTDTGDDALLAHLARRQREPISLVPQMAFDMAATGSPTALAAEVTAVAARDALVWRSRGSQVRTWWLHCQAGQLCTLVAERSGLWLAGASDIYGWQVDRRMVRVCDMANCAESDGVCNPGSAQGGPLAGRLDEVFWLALSTGKKTRLGPRLPDRVAVDLGSPGLHAYFEPLAASASGLLVRSVTETMACGAMNGGTAAQVSLARPGASMLDVPWTPTDEAALLQLHHDELVQAAESQKTAPFVHLATVYLDLDDAGRWLTETEWQAEPSGSERPDQASTTRLLPVALSADVSLSFGLLDLADAPAVPPRLVLWPELAGPKADAALSSHQAGWTWLPPRSDAGAQLKKFQDWSEKSGARLRHAQPHKP